MMERLLVALSGKVRKATLNGRNYLVASAVIGAEGVLNGSGGPGFYPGPEWAKAVPAWNMKPITNGHPKDAAGNFISAADPAVIESVTMGFLLNTKWDDKLKTECWFDEELTKKVDSRVYDALVSNKITEVSTGVFVTPDATAGEYNGTKYTFVAKDHQPDHLAILMDEVGAFSVDMGAGLMVNQKIVPNPYTPEMVVNGLSLGDVLSGVRQALHVKFEKPGYEWYGYVEDVYKDYAVYYSGGKLYKVGYSVSGDTVTLADDQVEVVRVIQYQTTDGKIVGNASVHKVITNQEYEMSVKFDKAAHLTSLIGNGYAEADREWLEKLSDDVLAKVKPVPVANTVVVPKEEPKVETPVVNATTVTVPKPPTFTELLANADPATKEQFSEMQASYAAEKGRLVGVITANKANTYTAEALNAKPLADLRAIAALAAPVANEAAVQQPIGFFGAAPAAPVVNAAPQDFLPAPTVNMLFPETDAAK